MKYLIILTLLIICLIYGQISEFEFPVFVNLALVVSILMTQVLWEFSILNKNYESDFKMRSQNKVIGKDEIINAIAWTLLLYLGYDFYKNTIFLILTFWAFPIAEFLMVIIYKNKKPYTLFINNNELILNKRWTQKRNLTKLTQIQFDQISKNLKLYFKSKSRILIKTTEYKTEEIETLLGILIEKSENDIYIPDNYKPRIKNSC